MYKLWKKYDKIWHGEGAKIQDGRHGILKIMNIRQTINIFNIHKEENLFKMKNYILCTNYEKYMKKIGIVKAQKSKMAAMEYWKSWISAKLSTFLINIKNKTCSKWKVSSYVPVMKNVCKIWNSEGAKIQDGHHGILKIMKIS